MYRKDTNQRLPRDQRCPIRPQLPTLTEWLLDITCCLHCRHLFEKSSRSSACEKLPRNPIQHLHARISRCFLERTISSTPHTMPWKGKESTVSPTTRPTIGPSKKLPIICWVCWNRRNRATRSSAVRLSPVAK